jgi:hypothetical protein
MDLLVQKYIFTISPNQSKALVVRFELKGEGHNSVIPLVLQEEYRLGGAQNNRCWSIQVIYSSMMYRV